MSMNKEDLKKIEEKLLSEKVRIEKDLEKLKGGWISEAMWIISTKKPMKPKKWVII